MERIPKGFSALTLRVTRCFTSAPDRAIGTLQARSPRRQAPKPGDGISRGFAPPGRPGLAPPPAFGDEGSAPPAVGGTCLGFSAGGGMCAYRSPALAHMRLACKFAGPHAARKAAGVLCAAKRRLWLAAARAAFARAARARACRSASPCFRSALRSRRRAAVCGCLQVLCRS